MAHGHLYPCRLPQSPVGARLHFFAGVFASMFRMGVGQVCSGYTFSPATPPTLGSHLQEVRSLAWIPAADSGESDELLASGGQDQQLKIWQVAAGTGVLLNTLGSIHGTIYTLEWIADIDSGVLASGSGDGVIRLWPVSVLTANQVCHQEALGNGNAICCDGDGLGCDGARVASWRDSGMSRKRQVFVLRWVAGESKLFAAWGDGIVRSYTHSSGAIPPLSLQDTFDPVGRAASLTWLGGGTSYLAVTSTDTNQPELWDMASLSAPAAILSRDLGAGGFGLCPYAHCDSVPVSAAADGTGDSLATGSLDGNVKVWAKSSFELSTTLDGHTGQHVTALLWMNSDGKLVSGSSQGDIAVWNPTAAPGDPAEGAVAGAHSGQVSAFAWIETLGLLASASHDNDVKLWSC